MYAQGVTCSDCHEPHSLKLRAPANAMCAQCHLPAKFDTAQHTHHAEGTPGAACAACHMPTTTYMGVDPRHDHSHAHSTTRRLGEIGHAERMHQLPRQANSAMGGRRDRQVDRQAAGGLPDFRRGIARRLAGRARSARRAARAGRGQAQPAIVRASAIARLGRLLTPVVTRSVATRAERSGSARAAGGGRGARGRGACDAAAISAPDARRPRAHGADRGRPRARGRGRIAAHGERACGIREGARRVRGRADLQCRPARGADQPRQSLRAARRRASAIAEYRKAIALDPTFVPRTPISRISTAPAAPKAKR